MFEVDGVLRAAANELFERRDRIVTSLGRLTARRQNMSPATQAATTGRRLLRDKDKYLKSGGVVRPYVHFLPPWLHLLQRAHSISTRVRLCVAVPWGWTVRQLHGD